MLIKMMLDHAHEGERPIVRGLLRHIIVGFGSGFGLGAAGYALILFAMRNNSIEIPFLFVVAACLQLAAIGGLIGAGVFMSRITQRDSERRRDPYKRAPELDQMLDPEKDRPAPRS
ncbi:MAG: hypothetical protein AAFQ84_09555 [Pseudomonadota bacterium]